MPTQMTEEEIMAAVYRPGAGLSSGLGSVGTYGTIQKQPEFGTAFEAMERAIGLCTRMIALADRICGAEPETATQASNMAQPDGVAPMMARRASVLRSNIHDAEEAMQRIEGTLP